MAGDDLTSNPSPLRQRGELFCLFFVFPVYKQKQNSPLLLLKGEGLGMRSNNDCCGKFPVDASGFLVPPSPTSATLSADAQSSQEGNGSAAKEKE